ncbi:MAG: NADH-quinone oxidoreductase subunit NuoG [Desulfuromonadaceae bacterium]|nr:NADH-quinone oxidoreductase subunit NuoG [Desulfuromonadaceae bacterium]MDD5106614.1 NADH-quinone oxidoreductase subunit NuoG [Desulfuromonadaceae bacterium]
MPKLIIDNIPVEVAEGTTVLEAAQSVDIPIPHFCWHPALGKAGACRVCAVKMLDGPVKGIQMSCMLPVMEEMVVSTTDPEAMAMRRSVIEWLMINHPHDCPVCDEGGECQLQDYTIAGGHGIRRYTGTKRTHVNQQLGPYIEHEMNRCIQCYRCVRFYQEYAGGTDFGVMGSAGRVYFGRFQDGPLESPFSGNLVDICPTGVFTDKTARFRARYWDYDMAPSICQECSLGCSITPVARYRELLKIIGRRNDAVNAWFICDRGRFSAATPVNNPLRPRTPRIEGREAGWDSALDAIVQRVSELLKNHGPGCIALVGSQRLSLEGMALLPELSTIMLADAPCYFCDERERVQTSAAVTGLTGAISASMADIRQADCIAIVDVDLMAEAPMMVLAVRQAWRSGAGVYSIGETVDLPCECTAVATLDDVPLATAQRPVIICGTSGFTTARQYVSLPMAKGEPVKISCILPGPNSFSAALFSHEHAAISLEQAISSGRIKGIIAVEADIPPELSADIPVIAALDWRNTDTVAAAQIILPTTAWAEMDGTCINNEGRAQHFRKTMNPGLPVHGLNPAGHPSHLHRTIPPGGDLRPAWQIIDELIVRMGGTRTTEQLNGKWEKLRHLDAEGDGLPIYEL